MSTSAINRFSGSVTLAGPLSSTAFNRRSIEIVSETCTPACGGVETCCTGKFVSVWPGLVPEMPPTERPLLFSCAPAEKPANGSLKFTVPSRPAISLTSAYFRRTMLTSTADGEYEGSARAVLTLSATERRRTSDCGAGRT